MRVAILHLIFAATLIAGELPEDQCTASPDGRFRVNIAKVGNTNTRKLEIRSPRGELLYSSPQRLNGNDILDFYPEHLRWSPDSKLLAIAAGYSRNIQTYLFAWDGSRFEQVAVPALAVGYDNPWIVPTEWKSKHRLFLKISGPHAGKARDTGYAGTATVAVNLQQKTAAKIDERVESY